MDAFFTPRLSFCAFTLTGLGWLYSAFAYFGPLIFHRGIIQHAFATPMGYQFGRTIFWRLSQRAAWWIAVVSIAPLLALVFPSPADIILLSVSALLILSAWLTHTPGRQVGLVELRSGQGELPFFELRANPGIFRSIVVFCICGMIPAAIIGAAVTRLLNLWMLPK